jgi:hypothetical protein
VKIKDIWKTNHAPHPWTIPYNIICLRCKKDKHYHDTQRDIHYSLCLDCLKKTDLGPFRLRLPPVAEDYS